MTENRIEAEQTIVQNDVSPAEWILRSFYEFFGEAAIQASARFIADLVSSPPNSVQRMSVEWIDDNVTLQLRRHRDSTGACGSELIQTWTSMMGAERHRAVVVESLIGRRLETTCRVEIELMSERSAGKRRGGPAGVEPSWRLKQELEYVVDQESSRQVFLPVSRTNERWSSQGGARLLEAMVKEVSTLLRSQVTVHPQWGTASAASEQSGGPSSGTNRTAPSGATQPSGRQFSGTTAGGSFSLQDQMASVGIKSIDELYQRLAAIQEAPAELTSLANALASIPDDDDLGRVLARLMFACSCVDVVGPVTDQIMAGLSLAKLRTPVGETQGMPISHFAAMVCGAGVDAARQTGLGRSCVDSLGMIADIWCNDLPAGEKRIGGQHGRAWVAAIVLFYLAEISAGTTGGVSAVTNSLQGGAVPSLRQQVAEMWSVGRAWAKANGVDFDDFVRRHA